MRRLAILFLGLTVLLAVTGCIKRGYDIFLERCPSDWTKAQKEAAWAWWLRNYYGKQEGDTWVVDTSKITVDHVLRTVASVLDDIDWVLDPQKSPTWRALLLELRDYKAAWEREEQKWLYIQNQLNQVRLYRSFLEMLGDRKDVGKEYSILFLWPENTQFNWSAEYVEKAKEEGKLQMVESGFYYVYTPYGYKVPDPLHPNDPAAFIWEPKLEGFLVFSFAILNNHKPDALRADYVEIYRARLLDDGTIEREAIPCLRAFRKVSGYRLQVAVIDYDHEGQSGYGTPDEVRAISYTTGWEIINNRSIREALARSEEEQKEMVREIVLKPLDLKIVRLGAIGEYRGEYNEEGWSVPYEYKDEYGVNYQTKLVEEELPEDYPFRRIAYVVKVWKDGAVWEYWRPKPEYAVDMEFISAYDRSVTVHPVGKARQTLSTDAVIDSLYKIIYRDGDTWVEIVDLDNTGLLQYRIVGVPGPNTEPVKKEEGRTYKRNL